MSAAKVKFKNTEAGKNPKDWDRYKLCDLIDINPKRELEKGSKAKAVSMKDLQEYNKKIQNYSLKKYSGGSKFKNGDTLMARITPCLENGKTAFVDILNKNETGFGSTEFIVLSKKEGITTHDFVYYLSVSPQVRDEAIKSMTGTSGRQRVQTELFRNIDVIAPKINEQKAIAKILSDLDAKIELNQKMNKTLENIAQAIFKHWFIDYEFPCLPSDYVLGAGKPVLAEMQAVCTYKAVGGLPIPEKGKYFVYVILCKDESFYIGITNDLYSRWYEHKSGIGAKWTKANEPIKVIHYEEYANKSEAAKREKDLKTGFGRKWLKREYVKYLKTKAGLPAPESKLRQAGKMKDSELGEIPDKWEVGKMGEENFAEIIGSGINKFDGKKIYLATADVSDSNITNTTKKITFQERPSRANMQPIERSIWFAKMQDSRKLLMFDDYSEFEIKNFILSTGFAGIKTTEISHNFMWHFILSKEFDKLKNNMANGSVQIAVNNTNLKKIGILIPDNVTLTKFNNLGKPIFKKNYYNNSQIQSLARSRDALLPKLMSGKIQVKL